MIEKKAQDTMLEVDECRFMINCREKEDDRERREDREREEERK